MENRLKELRTRDKKTQQNIADLFGVSKMAVKRWETGENDMKPYVIERLSEHFGVSISYFLKMSDSPDGNDKPTGFDSVEEYEKARKIFLEKTSNDDNYREIGIAHGASGKEQLIPNIGTKKEPFFVVDYSQVPDLIYKEEIKENHLPIYKRYLELNSEYKELLFLNTLNSIDESKIDNLEKVGKVLSGMEESDKINREAFIEELKSKKD
ncbi:helix-turn-helix domain-containing protein [Streptococcus uberis]|uniref:helix-turn-helix domain-containing protein n=1 Tax=Streptococcus uberis TaxID=1349 RepID=UPI0012B50F1E|nr:helix-turn-helix transcriptional regulator [Streptococcus uberis]MTB61581.1 helix-turn-helix domain-containing protein [Streptococcus uberis]MTB91897.1 helix-turn-helix domain-containing protein [Streptococcus uberis]